jgi:hypothetical protein
VRNLLPVVLLLTGMLAGGCGHLDAGRSETFELARLDGSVLTLTPDDATKAWVFAFIGTECPISNRCLPELNQLSAEFAAQGIRFFLVYPNADETPDAIRRHQDQFSITGEVFRDPQHQLARRLNTHVTPEVVAVTPSGQTIYRGRVNDQFAALGQGRPAPTQHDLADALRAFVNGAPPSGQARPAVGCTFRVER